MIDPKHFTEILKKSGVDFFTGVPDSLMKGFCSYIDNKSYHVSSTSEGSAIGLAIGYHLATGKIPLVYLQNSGIGNIVNPIISLVNKKVFKIPLLLLIGWRGETKNRKLSVKDEPQHNYQGFITEKLLKLMQVKHKIISSNSNYSLIIKKLINISKKNSAPVALLVRKNTFSNFKVKKIEKINCLSRKEILKIILENIKKPNIISTTGTLSRELLEFSEQNKKINNFYCVGGMGHATTIASGIALHKRRKKIICLDGDGSALMHLGSQVINKNVNNILHVLINNGVHDSVGAQKTAGEDIKFYRVAKELGYKKTYLCKSPKDIIKAVKFFKKSNKSVFIEVLSKPGFSNNLPRPKEKLTYYKQNFMKNLKK